MAIPVYSDTGRGKCIVWTLYNFGPNQVGGETGGLIDKLVERGIATYCVYQEEKCPRTGTIHLQGYTEFTERKRWSEINKLFGLGKKHAVHYGIRRGTPKQASDYCKKPERVEGGHAGEYGVMTAEHEGQGKRNDLLIVKELVDEGKSMMEIAESNFPTFVRYNKGIQLYKQMKIKPRNRNTICFVLYGVANAGKTEAIKQTFGQNAVWITPGVSGVWYDNYEQQPVVVFDEFKGWMPFTMLKRIVDGSPLTLDAKGASRVFNSRIVVFISNDKPEEWYKDLSDDNSAALQRRLHFVFKAEERLSPSGTKLGYACVLKKCMLPWNAHVADDWNIPKLTHDESLEVITWGIDATRREELKEKSGLRFLDRSEGVILTPSLHRDKSFIEAFRLIYEETMGQDPADPGVPDLWTESAKFDQEMDHGDCSELAAPAAASPAPRSVKNTRHDMLYKPSVFKSNYPELTWDALNDIKATRDLALPKPVRKRSRKNPYIDDECEVSGSDVSSDESE